MPLFSRSPLAFGILLSFAAAFVDTIGFVALFELFTAHVTGNFIVIGATLIGHHGGLAMKLLALPVFVVSVVVTTLAVRALEHRGRQTLGWLLAAQIVLLCVFMASGMHFAPIVDADAWSTAVTGLIAVAAMGIQNAGSRIVFPTIAPTTVMTGNVTQVVVDLTDLSRRGTDADLTGARMRLGKMLPAVLAFAMGSLTAALLWQRAGFACVALAIAALVVAFFVAPAGQPAPAHSP
ncbi:uncharacterized membrane protein YoaK (UPF0700 family) [Luteibacter rhizovicinus]|uniref:Uncharacterized membrane protein YoaK (UPF0700 family) n=1 Tax=Luteibacter rhizovicinus TaxID=242606 RepID=A0A4R3YSH6_9GAMM|nr:YoaK family protein [Luteibacter rhizovicinus]TCV95945.1 uncharacterized membrane protein YoaK (UPF0700 family) [Luteibacter rhizovicinus]